jgi:hypothetical protein
MSDIFTSEARKNISETGNVWGVTNEYFINRKIIIGRASFKIKGERASNFAGRFGGGWNYKLGIQFSRWTYVILNLFTFMIIFEWSKSQSSLEVKK